MLFVIIIFMKVYLANYHLQFFMQENKFYLIQITYRITVFFFFFFAKVLTPLLVVKIRLYVFVVLILFLCTFSFLSLISTNDLKLYIEDPPINLESIFDRSLFYNNRLFTCTFVFLYHRRSHLSGTLS